MKAQKIFTMVETDIGIRKLKHINLKACEVLKIRENDVI